MRKDPFLCLCVSKCNIYSVPPTPYLQLMHVNRQWDLEFREQEEAFRRYRFDSQQAQSETQALIARLKSEKEDLAEEVQSLKYEHSRGKVLEGGRAVEEVQAMRKKIAELQEEITFLRQQVCMCV